MNFIIDLSLTLIFIAIVFICFFRGFLKTVMVFIKVALAGFLAYLLQMTLGPLIGNIIPVNYASNIGPFLAILPKDISSKLSQNISDVLGSIIAFILLFILIYFLVTVVVSFLNLTINRFRIAKLLNRVGGGLLGFVLAFCVVFALSYLISVVLIFNNSTSGLATIQDSIFLKTFVVDNMKNLLGSILSGLIEKYFPFLQDLFSK